MSTAVRTHCLDASVLVKLFIEEVGSSALRTYLHGQANWYTTPFCFFEALSVLKRKKLKNQNHPEWISEEEYHRAGLALIAECAARSTDIRDLDFSDPSTFTTVQEMCRRHPDLDFSDAFQIISVKCGYFSRMSGDSKTVLVTADEGLMLAAEQEGLKVHLVR